MMMARIYYVGWRLDRKCEKQLQTHYGTSKRLHVTVVYSRNWFPYKDATNLIGPIYIYVEPTLRSHDVLGSMIAITFNSDLLRSRHNELIAAGAVTDYPGYQPHISLIPVKDLLRHPVLFTPQPIILEREYYQTWDEEP